MPNVYSATKKKERERISPKFGRIVTRFLPTLMYGSKYVEARTSSFIRDIHI